MTTINPCPFCGHDDVEIDEVRPGEYAVDCPECECIGPIRPEIMTAINDWNRAPRSIVNRQLLSALKLAEDFLAGFEDDECQEGMGYKLNHIRTAIEKAEAA